MSSSCPAKPSHATPALRWITLAAVGVIEVVAITQYFDAYAIETHGMLPLELAKRIEGLLGLGAVISIFYAMAVFAKRRLLFSEYAAQQRVDRWKYAIACHLTLAAAAAALANAIFIRGVVQQGGLLSAWAWSGMFFVATAGAAVFLALAAMPVGAWRGWLWQTRWEACAAAIAGATGILAGKLTRHGWDWLASYTFYVVEWMLKLFYPVVISQPEDKYLGTPRFAETIGPTCSGYEGIGLVLVFSSLFLWMFRRQLRFPRALLLIPVGCVAIWLANCLRIALLIAVGDAISPEIAVGGFHSQTGWLFFCLVSLSIAAVAIKSPWFSEAGASVSDRQTESPTARYVMPFLVLVAGIMIAGMASSGFDWLYPVRISAVGFAIWYFYGLPRHWEVSAWAAAVGVAVYGMWIAMDAPDLAAGRSLARAVAELGSPWSAAWIAFRAVGSSLFVPIAEELAFRGYLMRRVSSRDFENVAPSRTTWLALIASSLLFGLMHQRWIAATLAGLLYGLLYRRRGRIADPIVAHITTNALISAEVLLWGSWSRWI